MWVQYSWANVPPVPCHGWAHGMIFFSTNFGVRANSASYESGGLAPSSPIAVNSSGFQVHSHALKWIGRPRRTWSVWVVKPGRAVWMKSLVSPV